MKISPDFFEINLRPPGWLDDPDLRRAVEWFISFVSVDEWRSRRFAALERFLNAATGNIAEDASGSAPLPRIFRARLSPSKQSCATSPRTS